MTKKLILLFALAALFAFASSSYTVKLYDPIHVNGTELKPGDYKVTVENSKAVISKGKEKVEATVKVESVEEKFSSTSVRYAQENGKNKVQEIRLGGTKTKLVFN